MSTISVRDLQRNAKVIFDALEEDGVPLVITRRGLPVAALVAVNQQEAEAYLLASAPELIENRNSAEKAGLEGRTIQLSEALLEFEDETLEIPLLEPNQQSEWTPNLAVTWTGLAPLIGSRLVDVFEKEAVQFTEEVTKKTLYAVGKAEGTELGEHGKWQVHIQQLNERLFGLKFRDEILRVTQERLSAVSGGALAVSDIGTEGLVGRRQFDDAFKEVAQSVDTLNNVLLVHSTKHDDPGLTYQLLESGLQGGIASIAHVR